MKQAIKLNLGCGCDLRPGWINGDIDPSTNPDLLLDLQEPLPFQTDEVHLVLLQDVLEHLTKQQAEDLLVEINRILKPGGQLQLRIPNLEQIIHQFHEDPEVMFEFIYGTTETNGVWGAHKFGYNKETVVALLKQLQFTDISVDTETTNFFVTAIKRTQLPQMKLLVIQQSPAWGGAEEWMAGVVEGLSQTHRVKVWTCTNLPALAERFIKAGASNINLPVVLDIIGNKKGLFKAVLMWPLALFFYMRLLFNARQQGINLILMSGFSEKLLVSWVAKLFSIPVVWYEYGPLEPVFSKNWGLPKVLYRLTKHIPAKVITLSKNTKIKLIPSTRISLAKLQVIAPGTIIPPQRAKPKTFTVGSLSRLTPEKGQLDLLRAWLLVIKQIPKAKLKIAGEGSLQFQLQDFIRTHNLENSVELLGFVANKSMFYESLSVFVFPSLWKMEGFGLVMIEAMSFGVSVIAFDRAPANEIVTTQSGVLVPDGNIDALAEAILSLYDSQTQQILATGARQQVDQKFNYHQQIARLYRELYKVVCQHTA